MHRIIAKIPTEPTHIGFVGMVYDGLMDIPNAQLDEVSLAKAMDDPDVIIIAEDKPEIGPDPVGRPKQKEIRTPRLDEELNPVLDAEGNPVEDITYEDELDAEGNPIMEGIGDPIQLYPDTILKNSAKPGQLKKRHEWSGQWRGVGEDLPAPVADRL